MSSDFSPDDIDDILSEFDDDDFSDIGESTVKKKKKKEKEKGKGKIIAPILVLALLGGGFVAYKNMDTIDNSGSNNVEFESTVETTEAGNTTINNVELVNAEQVEYAKEVCSITSGWARLETLPTYTTPANLITARKDMVNVLKNNIQSINFMRDSLQDAPEKSYNNAKETVANSTLLDVYSVVGDNPTTSNITNNEIIIDAYNSYTEAMQSMVDDLVKPATYDAYGLNEAIKKVQDGFSAIDNNFNETIKGAFNQNSYDNLITISKISDIPNCEYVDPNGISSSDTILLEEQKKVQNDYISYRCDNFISNVENSSSNDSVVEDNKKICESQLTNTPASNNAEFVINGTPHVYESAIQDMLTLDTENIEQEDNSDTENDSADDESGNVVENDVTETVTETLTEETITEEIIVEDGS